MVWGIRDGARGRDARDRSEAETPAVASAEDADLPSGKPATSGTETVKPAVITAGQTVSRTPCHDRRVRIEGDITGQSVVVRCPFCSRLWEVRFPPATAEPMFALWVA